jgi:hypothetical protein
MSPMEMRAILWSCRTGLFRVRLWGNIGVASKSHRSVIGNTFCRDLVSASAETKAILCIDHEKVTPELAAHLAEGGVEVCVALWGSYLYSISTSYLRRFPTPLHGLRYCPTLQSWDSSKPPLAKFGLTPRTAITHCYKRRSPLMLTRASVSLTSCRPSRCPRP